MKRIRTLIVDDEPLAQRVLQRFVGQVDRLELMGVCSNAIEASNLLRDLNVELLFLDIRMPELSGLELLKTIKNPPNTILTTAFGEYALESYEYGVVDYLVKPFVFDRFLKAIDKVTITEQKAHVPIVKHEEKRRNFLFVKSDRKIFKVDFDQIKYLEAFGNYVKIHMVKKVLLAQDTLSGLEQALPTDQFLRIHKSFVVAIPFIHAVEGNILFLDDVKLSIGNTFKQRVGDILGMR